MERRITSSSDMPIARNLSITFSMSFMPEFMLPVCRSVEMESGMKSLLHRGHRDAPRETAAAVAHIEDDAALAPFDHPRIHFAVIVEFVPQPGIAVRVDVARPQFLGQQIGQRALRMIVRRNPPSPESSPALPASTACSTGVHSGPV